jgi:hypothetical protein
MTLRECGDVQRFLPGLHGALVKMGSDEPMDDNEEFASELLNDARNQDMLEQERTGRIQWSRFDYLRNLGDHQAEETESVHYRELINDAFELNLDVLNNNTVQRDNTLRFPDKPKRPAYLSW